MSSFSICVILNLSSWNRSLKLLFLLLSPMQSNFYLYHKEIFKIKIVDHYLLKPISLLLVLDFTAIYTPLISYVLVVSHPLSTDASQLNFQLPISCLHLGLLQASYSLNCCISNTELIILYIPCVPWLN